MVPLAGGPPAPGVGPTLGALLEDLWVRRPTSPEAAFTSVVTAISHDATTLKGSTGSSTLLLLVTHDGPFDRRVDGVRMGRDLALALRLINARPT